MKSETILKQMLKQIDGKGYKAYKDIKGEYNFRQYILTIDHVQGDPFATPSRIKVRVDRNRSGFKNDTTSSKSRKVALCDFLTRHFYQNCRKFSKGNRGSGKSGLITIDKPAQEIFERSSMIINDEYVEARFQMALPAAGRKVSAKEAGPMFFEELPKIINMSLFMECFDPDDVYRHIETAEDADFLRSRLNAHGIVCFVADGSLLPRATGIDPAPLISKEAVLFKSPESIRVEIELPNNGKITGMGIPEGVTLIVGGGYHGKSTLLKSLELGIYDHIPNDGREFVVSVPDAVKIRAADGRSISNTDISSFINNLPLEKDTSAFSTQNASGSTSQAANIAEAVEAGAKVLLLDEDTSATNFMIRDFRMQQLVTKDKEPIIPFVDNVKQMYKDQGISTILVMGGSGDYFSVADHVIQMTDYVPYEVTNKAIDIAKKNVTGRMNEGSRDFGKIAERIPVKDSFNPYKEKNKVKISIPRPSEILFGHTSIDLWDIEQITEISQTRALGYAIYYAMKFMDGKRTLREITDLVLHDIEKNSLDILTPYITGDLAVFRSVELAAAINRMRTLKMMAS